jgi:hypothetical protein
LLDHKYQRGIIMTTIVTRSGKGDELTFAEMDTNLTNLNSDKLETSNNLSDVSDAATARTNLGAASSDDALALAIALG